MALSSIGQSLFNTLGEEPGQFTPGGLPVYDFSGQVQAPAGRPEGRLTPMNSIVGQDGNIYTLYSISGKETPTGDVDPETNQPITTVENLGYLIGPPAASEGDRGFFGGLLSSVSDVLKQVPILPMGINMVAPGVGSALTAANALATNNPMALVAALPGLANLGGVTEAATAASDLAKIEASMGVPSFATAATPLAVENIAGQFTPEAQALMQPNLSMIPPPVFNEPVLVPGDNLLSSTLAQPPLAVENIAGQLTPEAQGLMTTVPFTPTALPAEIPPIAPIYQTLPITPPVVETPAAFLSPEAQALMAATGPVALGSAEKAALYGTAGYGPGLISGEAPIIESVATSMGPGKEISAGQIAKDIITNIPGAAQQYATTALTTLGVDPDLVNKIVGATGGTTGGSKTTTQPGNNLAGVVLGSLLGRQAPAAPQAGVSRGQAVNIVSPIESLLAPKLVQQRPVSLL